MCFLDLCDALKRDWKQMFISLEICQRRSFLRWEVARLTHNVQRTVQIRVDKYAIFCSIEPPFDAGATELVGGFLLAFFELSVGRDEIVVQKTRLGGVAFVLRHKKNPNILALVSEDFDERNERNMNEILVIHMTEINIVLPSFCLTDDEFRHTLAEEERDKSVCDSTEKIANLIMSPRQ